MADNQNTRSDVWKPAVLVLDDEWSTLERIRSSLGDRFDISVASRPEEALDLMARRPAEVVLSDVRMPDMDGLSLVSEMKTRFPETQYILMTAFSDIEDTIRAIRLGVSDYLRKPFTMSEVQHAIDRCMERHRLRREVASLRSGTGAVLSDVVANSPQMLQVCRLAQTVAPTDVTVLISGETGTGKGLMARAMHNVSPRRDRPYVEINCAAIPANLIESELFGHEKGSFTGAFTRKIGRVEAADGGTLFLDEVGEMPLDMQAKLLRFLQEFTFERVGGNKKLSTDVRVIAASNRDLVQSVAQGQFREDLYYRLHVIQIHLPALRERSEDLAVLAEHFLGRYSLKYGKTIHGLGAGALEQINGHSWPGNVRELQHCMERSVILCPGRTLERLLLDNPSNGPGHSSAGPSGPLPRPAAPTSDLGPESPPLAEYLAECERAYLKNLLQSTSGRIGQTAAKAGVDPKTLYLKMNRHGLSKEEFRKSALSPRGPHDRVS